MASNTYDLSAGLFVRGLTNLQTQLAKAEVHAAGGGAGEVALLDAKMAAETRGTASHSPHDLHGYSLAAHVHWAGEGAKLAIARLLCKSYVPAINDAKTFSDVHERLDATIAYLEQASPTELEVGLGRVIVVEHRRGSTSASGSQFLIAFAIPHYFYHLTTAYGILRNQGVPLTMGDFLGNWGIN